jgi:predicted transcriptional regulator of viral defense system
MIEIFKTKQTVFDLKDLWKILNEPNYNNLKSKVSYYVKKWYLTRIRKWIFVKDDFDVFELACKIYTPSYISFETVLSQEGIIYQKIDTIYVASYLSRTLKIDYKDRIIKIVYRKLKDEILYNPVWIIKKDFYSIASWQRAIQDMKYLKKDFYFDNLKYESKIT